MSVIELGDHNFREVYQNNEIIIVDFWAPWCGPCLSFAPTFEKVAEKHADVVFGKVNTEFEQKLAQHFSVRSIPTIMVIREGVEVFYNPGTLTEADLEELVARVKALDMAKVQE